VSDAFARMTALTHFSVKKCEACDGRRQRIACDGACAQEQVAVCVAERSAIPALTDDGDQSLPGWDRDALRDAELRILVELNGLEPSTS